LTDCPCFVKTGGGTNMFKYKYKNKDKIIVVIFATFALSPFWLSILLPKPKSIAALYISKNEDISVQIPAKCSKLRFGSYTFYEVRLSGEIVQTDCVANVKTDRIEYKFTSNHEEKKDCYGKMTKIELDKKITMIWEFEGSVSGHNCPLLGKSWKSRVGDAHEPNIYGAIFSQPDCS
jgi:hypothetical protein